MDTHEVKHTVLEMVLSSFCPYHRMLLYHILKCIHEDYIISATPYADGHSHFSKTDSLSCHLGKNPDNDMFAFTDYRTSDGCYVHSCRLDAYSVTPGCFCLKNLHYLSCQRMAFGCISKFVSPNSCGGYAHPQRCACPFQGFSQSPYTMRSGLSSPFSLQKVCDPLSPRIRACSSSPPPLSPMPLDVGAKPSDNSLVCPFAGSKCFSSQPPSLFVQEVEDDPLFHKFNKEHSSTEEMEKHTPNEDCTDCCTQTEKNFEQNQSGTLLQNLMERINKQLKCIEPLEKEQNLGLRASQTLACSSEVRLGEILSTVLHKETDNDYNLKELLCQHQLIVEEKSIQTHFHRKKDSVTAAGSTGLATCPHRCLQIKRELASLCTLPCRRKLELEKQGENVARDDLKTQLSCVEVSLTNSEKDNVSENKMSTMKKHDCDNSTSVPCTVLLCSTLEDEEKPPEVKKSDQEGMNCRHRNASIKKHRLSCQPVGDSSRSRRNIVPPQRFSAYVTEPRKMYFAACFSESIFSKRAHKDAKAIGGEMSSSSLDLNESSTKLNLLNETSKTTLQPKRLAESKHFSLKSADCHLSNASRTRSGKLNHSLIDQQSGDGEVKQCIQRRSKRRTATSHSCVKLASLTNDQNDLAESIKTREDAVSTSECSSLPPYSSPIRLMFVSPVVSEEGVKYSLKSANSGSISQQETFDPCEESSWGGPAKSEEEETEEVETLKPRVTRGDESNPLKRPVTTNDSSPFSEEHNMQGETCFLIHGLTLSPPKRKPGRPKKLGPQIEKPAKRPIGRPPKHKAENSKCVSTVDSPNAVNKNSTSHSHSEDDGRKNKNLKITVVFGRSRRIRRLVSESSGHLVSDQQMNGGLQSTYADGSKEDKDLSECSVGSGANAESSNKLLDGQTENFDFVMPVKNKRSHTNRNIKCAEQKCSVAMRKPGRPPKVKISGISVTVTTVSPKRRNICINKDMTELHNEMSQKAKPFISHHENPKEQTTISLQSDVDDGEKIENIQDGTMSQKIPVPLRHSVRIRKPSIHLLHSVATSRTFTRSNALLRRSRKLLLNKTSSDSNQKSLEKPCGETSSTMTLESPPRNAHGQDLSFLSGISVDSIFTNEPFKWWPTSASAESLNAEFTRRVQLLSDTWVTESSEGSKSISTERELNLKSRIQPKDDEPPMNYFSPVKMLFQTHWNMDKLCAWFMQTTETQSLAIVKKASVRNPYEIVQYNPTRTTSQTVCPSPQAERLRMHVKKFAKIVPKSPAMHRQAQKKVFDAAQLKIKRRLVSHSSGTVLRSFGHRCLLSRHKMLGKYGFLLLRVKSKFMSRKKICHSLARPLLKMPSDAFCGIIPCPSKEFQQTFSSASPVIETENCSSNVERELRDRQPEKTLTDVSQEERICSKTWSPERLKECRVFLKKINSPETKSAAEECNFCTIKLDDVSSSGYSLPSSTVCADRNVKKESRRSPQILSPSCPEEQQILSRKQKRKSHGTSGSQPAKIARQSLNSGQNGQKWSLCQKAPNNRKTILVRCVPQD